MPASGAGEKNTGRIERRITYLGLAYTSTSCKVKNNVIIYCLAAFRVWVSLSISIHLYNCALIYSSTPAQRKEPITCLGEHGCIEQIPDASSSLSYRMHTERFSWPEIEVWGMGSDSLDEMTARRISCSVGIYVHTGLSCNRKSRIC